MPELMSPMRTLRVVGPHERSAPALPACPLHPGSLVRRYRAHGADGPGVYPQCVPDLDGPPHLLEWPEPEVAAEPHDDSRELTECELAVLTDAANGLTTLETARKRVKGVETVKSQRRSILLKLGARNMAHAVAITNEMRTS